MWTYSKKLEYPVKIARPDAAAAKVIISQLGGPDGEMGAATRYLSQRYTAPWGQVKAGLTDIGTEPCSRWYDCVRTTKPETRINTTFFVGQAFSGCVLIRTTFIRK